MPPCSSSSTTTSPSSPSWPTAWWPWTRTPCSRAARAGRPRVAPRSARPCSAPARWPCRARGLRRPGHHDGRHGHGGGRRMSDSDAEPRPAEQALAAGEPAAHRCTGRPHRGRAGGRRRARPRAREQHERHHHHHHDGAGSAASSAGRACPWPTPRHHCREDGRPATGAPIQPQDGAAEDADRLLAAESLSTAPNGGASLSGVSDNTINVMLCQAQPGGLAASHLGAGPAQHPGARYRPGVRGHVQPGLRALRAAREPHPLHRVGGRHRSGGGSRRRRRP